MVGAYEALLWLCECNLGEQRGKRAKGEQTGSLNRVFFTDLRPFSRIWGFFGDSGPFSWIQGLFRGFGAFFGDLRPFRGFAAFSRIRCLFVDSLPFRGFAAFSRIRCLFADSRPFCRFADSRPRERRERTSHLAKLSLPDIYSKLTDPQGRRHHIEFLLTKADQCDITHCFLDASGF